MMIQQVFSYLHDMTFHTCMVNRCSPWFIPSESTILYPQEKTSSEKCKKCALIFRKMKYLLQTQPSPTPTLTPNQALLTLGHLYPSTPTHIHTHSHPSTHPLLEQHFCQRLLHTCMKGKPKFKSTIIFLLTLHANSSKPWSIHWLKSVSRCIQVAVIP